VRELRSSEALRRGAGAALRIGNRPGAIVVKLAASFVFASLVAVSGLAAAEPAAMDRADTVNLSILGLAAGNYAVTYEHLSHGTHGLILEGEFAHGSNDSLSETSVGGGIGYRWHWSGQQNSGFLGVMLEAGRGSGSVTEDGMTVPLGIHYTTLTANIGKRWTIGDRGNITLRLGAGAGSYTAVTDDTSASAKQAQRDMNSFLALIPVAVDGELSFGYAF